MSRISRVEAFLEVTRAMENNKIEEANKMFRVITDSIANDKENNTFSTYIELKNKTQENLFRNILIKDDES